MKHKRSKLVCLFFVITALFCTPLCVYADTTVTGSEVLPETGQQFRYLKTVETKWTGAKYVSGQAKNGYTLKKGDMLYYSEGGGSTTAVTVAAGFGAVSVSMDIPLGKKASKGVGIGLKIPSDGTYKIRVNKQIKATIKTTQVRNVKYNASTKKYEPVAGDKGKWKHLIVTSKKYTVLQVVPKVVKQ